MSARAVADAVPTTEALNPDEPRGPSDALTREDLRLAHLHLRLGMLSVARAELEDLRRREALDLAGLAALAEARWRAGDLEAAAEAAQSHLDGGGEDPIAIVVAAEAAATGGRPAEAQALVDRAALDAATLEVVFAGLPRRAYWPAAGAPRGAAEPAPPAATATPAGPGPAEVLRSIPGPREVIAATEGLWDAHVGAAVGSGSASGVPAAGEPAIAPTRPAAPPAWVEPARPKGHADPAAELEAAGEELGYAPERGLLRLALVLRLDPSLAPEILDLVRLRREPLALVIRGDAQRLLGRHLEAEAEFAEAAEAIERDAIARARRGGSSVTREDS